MVKEMKMQWDAIWLNGSLATCEQGLGFIKQGAIAVSKGRIAWLGAYQDLPGKPESLAENVYDLEHTCLTPGLIDCHTHAVYAGDRAHEFELRLQGASYEDIARQGGGIKSTVAATRAATEGLLFQESSKRLHSFLKHGVTTVEIKSGYGLDWQTELKILDVMRHLAEHMPMTIAKTFLGAHTIPHEYLARADEYIDLICEQMIPEIAKEKLADAVDVFCEKIAFNLIQTERVFKTARQYGLAVKCHAEQLSCSGSAQLAAKYQALSADHLEHIDVQGVKALAAANTVAVLLPGAFYYLRETRHPPIAALREHGVAMAIATDCNPGTSPILSLPLIMNMACTLFHMTIEEAWLGVTQHAARALGLEKTHGSLAIGKIADFAIWQMKHPNELIYYMGNEVLREVVKEGEVLG